MNLDPSTRERIEGLITSHDVMLFMKGNRNAPQCGFSATVVGILNTLVPDYLTHDVLSDPSLRDGIKEFSAWPTIPQLYVRGEFVGGCDIIQEMYGSGELHGLLGIELGDVSAPQITITPAAAEGLREATSGAGPDQTLHLGIDASFQSTLTLAPDAPGEIAVESEGIRLLLDRLSAQRAEGVTIDVVDTPQGRGFRIDNPNAPASVEMMSPTELKAKMDAGEAFELIDVRTPEERATASIPGAVLFTPEVGERLLGLPRDTTLVFHCHHGGRSQAAAEHFSAQGFTDVWNLVGGVDAWSQAVDPSVPRY